MTARAAVGWLAVTIGALGAWSGVAASTPPTEPPDNPAAIEPVTPGEPGEWQGVQSDRRPLAYDVPGEWLVETPGMMTGYEWEDASEPGGWGRIIFSGVATAPDRSPDDECESSPDALGSFGSNGGESDVIDTAALAEYTAQLWAERAFGAGNEPAEPVKVGVATPYETNGLEGHMARAIAHFGCGPGKGEVWVFTMVAPDLERGMYNVIYWGDANALPDETIEAMFDSVRERRGLD